MLTRLIVENFKRFGRVEIELGDTVVFVGPNNSGKTTALQALSLWEMGVNKWYTKRMQGSKAKERQGVVLNRRDLFAVPAPSSRLLWHDLNVRSVERVDGRQETKNILIAITVEGVTGGQSWKCGLEFDYANEEAFYVRPLRLSEAGSTERMVVPREATAVRVAYLPPMSGLAADEFVKQPGEISVLIGQGQTAQVLRNLCYRVCFPNGQTEPSEAWDRVCKHIEGLFGVKLEVPRLIPERSEITMSFREPGKGSPSFDLSASGRGLQQTLLLLAYIYSNDSSVLLLDEPDAHLEVLRQRNIFGLLRDVAASQGAQIVAASHSEVVLNEAAETSTVVAFVGKPHLLSDRGSQLKKSLTTIGWDQYFNAELKGWVLYIEGATDLDLLKALARKLDHPAHRLLQDPFVCYVGNDPQKARDHFWGLREAKRDLVGIAIFDRLDRQLQDTPELHERMWQRRELENYVASDEVLLTYARSLPRSDLFSLALADAAEVNMRDAIAEVRSALAVLGKELWGEDVKATDEGLDLIFQRFFNKQGAPVAFRKGDYHMLVDVLAQREIDQDIVDCLDQIAEVASRAAPRE
jgi:energy-coupling factor transporter ATP-binding protein EcfA2